MPKLVMDKNKTTISEENMINMMLDDASDRMQKQSKLTRDLATVRTGRATPAMLDRVMVNYYIATPINQMAGFLL
ncbi:MAG: ribosome recycling factor [Faecalibacillus faecis]